MPCVGLIFLFVNKNTAAKATIIFKKTTNFTGA